MYHALLTTRYLTSRVIPLIAVAAVALCVALVIIVVSVMTGFLDAVRSSGRTLMGDVVIEYPIQGIPHYERLMAMIESIPEATASTPVVDHAGVLRMPYPAGANKDTAGVRFWGIEPESFAKVTGFSEILHWKPVGDDEAEEVSPDDLRHHVPQQMYEDGLTLHDSRSGRPGIVLGIEVSRANQRTSEGGYEPIGHWWMPEHEVTLTTFPIDSSGGLMEPESFIFPVVNEFHSGVFAIDEVQVMIPLDIAQRMVHLDEAQRVDPDDPTQVVGTVPARVTRILVRAVEGVTPVELRDRVQGVYEKFHEEMREEHPDVHLPSAGLGPQIMTWEQQQAKFIGPVEKERELMRILFSIIYLVAAGLVLAIFWAIVHEKTRDIGILRSVGASRIGISMIFLRYGAIIGIVGAVVGLGIAYLVVNNINEIHSAMGERAPVWLWITAYVLAGGALVMAIWMGIAERMLPTVLWSLATIILAANGVALMLHKGTLLWDPSVYYFAKIPNSLDMNTAITTMIGAVIFSVLGAFIPAAKAADTDPVNALRYE